MAGGGDRLIEVGTTAMDRVKLRSDGARRETKASPIPDSTLKLIMRGK